MYRPPSLMIELSYFTINHRSLIGTSYEHEKLTTQPLPPGAHEDHPQAAVREPLDLIIDTRKQSAQVGSINRVQCLQCGR